MEDVKKAELKLHNSLTETTEVFIPSEELVGMSVCVVSAGPSHLGHARTAVTSDVLYRYLRHLKHQVTYVRNFTDLGDKVTEKASGFMEQYLADLRDLQCIPPTYQLCASDQMDHIVKMIEKMVEKDIGYQVGGDVFFPAGKSPNYSQLLDHTQAGDENVVVVDPRIRNRADFALWKAAKPGEPSWKSPWGPGRPGIHIECSAMSSQYLPPRFDIHGGGTDLNFLHQHNAIAQTCVACNGGVNYWFLNGNPTIKRSRDNVETGKNSRGKKSKGEKSRDNLKMGQALENFLTTDITSKYHPLALRLFLMSSHYRYPLGYSVLALERLSVVLYSVYQALEGLDQAVLPHREDAMHREDGAEAKQIAKTIHLIKNVKSQFEKDMPEDLETSHVLHGGFQEVLKTINDSVKKLKTFRNERLLSSVVSMVQVENAVKEVLDVLGLLSTLSYKEFLDQLKRKALARAKLAEQEMSEINLDSVDGTVVECLAWDSVVTTELMEFVTPAGNVLHCVRKTCGNVESEARKEFDVLSLVKGSVGMVQCFGDSLHQRETVHGDTVYGFYMEYASCGTLERKIQDHRKGLPTAMVVSFTRMILIGLRSLHEAGYVHGDLHSGNVLLFPREGEDVEEAKLSDVGIAKRIGDDLQNRQLGAIFFMSPESVCHKTFVPAHDIWSVGCLVMQMFTKSPWPKMCNERKVTQSLEKMVGPIIPPDLGDSATEFLNLCFAMKPEDRGTISDLLEHAFLN